MEASRNYKAMIKLASLPKSEIDQGTMMFLRHKLALATSLAAAYARDPLQAAARDALADRHDEDKLNLATLQAEIRRADLKAKKHKKDKKLKKDKKGKKEKKHKKEKEKKGKKAASDSEHPGGKWQVPSHALPRPDAVELALATSSARLSRVIAKPALSDPGPRADPALPPPLPPPHIAHPPKAAPAAGTAPRPKPHRPASSTPPASGPRASGPASDRLASAPADGSLVSAPPSGKRKMTEYQLAERAAAEGPLEKKWDLKDFGLGREPGDAAHRRRRIETLIRLKARAAALGARLPDDLAAKWPAFVIWYEREQRRLRGAGLAHAWIHYIVNPVDKNLKADPASFIAWVRKEMVGLPRPASTASV